MKSGYKIEWTDHALTELKSTFKFLEENWTETELKKLSFEIEKTPELISYNPNLFPISEKQHIRKAVVLKLNTIYYRKIENERIEILSFFSNRQNPKNRRI